MKRIILLRHGEVDITNNKSISSKEFKKWIMQYDNSDIKSEFSSKNEISSLLNEADILICSKLKRSIQSLEIFDKLAFESSEIFNEVQLPSFNTKLVKLKAKTWLVFFRLLWFFGYSKNCESYKSTKQRAQKAALKLMQLSTEHETVVLVGHGIMNKLIQKELILNKWKKTNKSQNKNWDYSVFSLV